MAWTNPYDGTSATRLRTCMIELSTAIDERRAALKESPIAYNYNSITIASLSDHIDDIRGTVTSFIDTDPESTTGDGFLRSLTGGGTPYTGIAELLTDAGHGTAWEDPTGRTSAEYLPDAIVELQDVFEQLVYYVYVNTAGTASGYFYSWRTKTEQRHSEDDSLQVDSWVNARSSSKIVSGRPRWYQLRHVGEDTFDTQIVTDAEIAIILTDFPSATHGTLDHVRCDIGSYRYQLATSMTFSLAGQSDISLSNGGPVLETIQTYEWSDPSFGSTTYKATSITTTETDTVPIYTLLDLGAAGDDWGVGELRATYYSNSYLGRLYADLTGVPTYG